jgi:sulfur carrier protein
VLIVVNGEKREFKNSLSIYELLKELKIEDKVMATAVNSMIVKKDRWKEYILKDGDRVEFLTFVGGG